MPVASPKNVLILLQDPVKLPVDILKYIYDEFIWKPWTRLLKSRYRVGLDTVRRMRRSMIMYGPGFYLNAYIKPKDTYQTEKQIQEEMVEKYGTMTLADLIASFQNDQRR